MESKSAGMPGHPTVLIGKRDDTTFEMWIEIDGRPLKVYGEAEMEGGGSEAWIASENGKRYTIHVHLKANQIKASSGKCSGQAGSFQEFRADFYCDGQEMQKTVFDRKSGARGIACEGRKVTGNQLQLMLFSTPTLVEDDTTGTDVEKLGTIEVVVSRGTRSNPRPWVDSKSVKAELMGAVNERSKKVLGLLTKLSGIVQMKEALDRVDFARHPDDKKQGYFRMLFRYAPQELLRAQGHIPVRVDAGCDAPGTSKRKAITVNDDTDKENARKVLETRNKKIPKVQKLEAAEKVDDVKPKIEAMAASMSPNRNGKSGSSGEGKTKANGSGRVVKKARTGDS